MSASSNRELQTQPAGWGKLPAELLLPIFLELDLYSRASFLLVCAFFNEILKEDLYRDYAELVELMHAWSWSQALPVERVNIFAKHNYLERIKALGYSSSDWEKILGNPHLIEPGMWFMGRKFKVGSRAVSEWIFKAISAEPIERAYHGLALGLTFDEIAEFTSQSIDPSVLMDGVLFQLTYVATEFGNISALRWLLNLEYFKNPGAYKKLMLQTCYRRAVNLRDLGSARELVSAGAAERDNDERLSLFLLAAASCDLAALQQLAVGPNFADANQVDAYGRNAIILAIRNGSAFESDITRVVSYLISIGTDPNISDNQGVQAIIRAIEKRMPAVVEVIWSHSRYLPGIFDRTHFTKYFYTVKDFRRALKFSIDRIKSLDSELFANEILFILLSPLTWKTTTHLRNQSIARDQLLAELTIIEARLPIIISSVIENGANPEVCLDKYYTEVEQSSSKSPIGICNIIIKNIAQFLFSEQERQLLLSAVTDAKQQMEAVVKKRAMQKQEDAERKSLNERIVYAAEEETRSPGLPATSPTLPDTVLHEPESRKVAQEILDELIYAVEQSGSAADSALKDEVVTLVENLNDSAIPVTETIAELRQVDTSEASCEVSAAFKAFISALSTAIACGLLFALVGAAATSWSGPGIVIGAIAGFIAGLIAGSIGAKCCLFSDTQQEEISPMHNHQMILCR